MPAKKRDQIKTYIVLGLSVVFVTVGYFRFIHKRVFTNVEPTPSTAPVVQLQVPRVSTETSHNPKPVEVSVSEPLRLNLRDIFAPLTSPASAETEVAKPEASKSVPVFTLGGTIVGGKKPMAIINDQLVRLGDWIGEFRVVSIGKKGVLLDSGSKKIALAMVRK